MSLFNVEKLKEIQQDTYVSKKHNILIVDDEPDNLDILGTTLESEYNITRARDGKEALEIIHSDIKPNRFDLIISDQRMPNLTGVDFLSQTISISPLTVRMILTAYSDTDAIIDAINKGHIYKFILKPYDREDMIITVKRALEAFELEQENINLLHNLKKANAELELKVEERTGELTRALEKQKKLNEQIFTQTKELKAINKKLSYFATTDSLTGLANRRHFLEVSNIEFAKSKRHNLSLSVLMLDIDHFKRINDVYGHSAGDKALVTFAKYIDQSLRQYDIAGRMGGEEFCIVLPQSVIQASYELAERIRKGISKLEIELDEKRIRMTVSIGLAQIHSEDNNIESAIHRADEALYKSKHNGRNLVSVND